MTRIFIDEHVAVGRALALRDDTAHYLLDVLRARPGDRFVVVAADGQAFEAMIDTCRQGCVEVTVIGSAPIARGPKTRLTLYQSVLKGKAFDLVIQKATELGVAAIVPVVTARTIARPEADRVEGRLDRWRKIATEACRQCGRAQAPGIVEPLPLALALQRVSASATPAVIPYEAMAGSVDRLLRDVLRSLGPIDELAALVGPEGGFTPQEVEAACAAGLQAVSLGGLILRAETAAIALCANVMYELG